MSTIHYHTCDHCGKKLDPMSDYEDLEIEMLTFKSVDLCLSCMEELERMVCAFVGKEKDDGET